MHLNIGKLAAIVALCALGACATPQQAADAAGGIAGRASGGDAEGAATRVGSIVTLAQPGGDAMSSQVSNEDQTENVQAGDAPQLLLGGQGLAKLYLEKDPAGDAMAARLAGLTERLTASGEDAVSGEERAALVAESESLSEKLVAHQERRLKAAAEMAGGLPQLQQVVFVVVQIKLNGTPPEKLTAEAIQAAAANMAAAVAPATERAKK